MKKNKQKNNESLEEGPIIEWDQDQWWREGKSRLKEERQPFFKSPKGIIISIGVSLTVISLVLLVFLSGRKMIEDINDGDDQAQVEELGLTPLQQQIKQLRSQLTEADPAIKDTPLPQVEMNIVITEE
jgi:hypothetical protein